MNFVLNLSLFTFICSLVTFIIGYTKIINRRFKITSCVNCTKAHVNVLFKFGRFKLINLSFKAYNKKYIVKTLLFDYTNNHKTVDIKYDPNFPKRLVVEYKYKEKSITGIVLMTMGLILSILSVIISLMI